MLRVLHQCGLGVLGGGWVVVVVGVVEVVRWFWGKYLVEWGACRSGLLIPWWRAYWSGGSQYSYSIPEFLSVARICR